MTTSMQADPSPTMPGMVMVHLLIG